MPCPRLLTVSVVLSCWAASCGPGIAARTEPDPAPPPPPAPIEVPTDIRDNLRWRTGWALQQHLMQALALDEGEVCNELGILPCAVRPPSERPFRGENIPTGISVPHLVALGGNDPFDQAHYIPPTAPGTTTPVAVDRLTLAACDARVEKDRAETPVVFAGLDFAQASVTADAAVATAIALFSRFHLRDATPDEIADVLTLTDDGTGGSTSPADFALAACFAVGSMSESLFD